MYDVTITNVNTLEITRTQVSNPFVVLDGMKWAEIHAQHEVVEQIDIRVTLTNGDIIHIKERKHND